MELLGHGLVAAAVSDLGSPLSGAGEGRLEDDASSFELSDYIHFGDEGEGPPTAQTELSSAAPALMACALRQNLFPPRFFKDTASRDDALPPLPRMEGRSRIAFRTKTDVETLDDGFRWRKYGKKFVKNRPNNPRCSVDGCRVKKRVEKDQEDPSFVITTYEGVHNHSSPGVVHSAVQNSVSSGFLFSGSAVRPPVAGSCTASSSTK